jgi:hypothetical protein
MNWWTVPLEWNGEWNTGMPFQMRYLFLEGIGHSNLISGFSGRSDIKVGRKRIYEINGAHQ